MIRVMYGHRLRDIAGIGDWCLGCGANPDPAVECRAGTPRCERPGCENPSDVTEFLGGERFDHCATCRNADREAV